MMSDAERVKLLREEIEALDHRIVQARRETEWAERLVAQKRLALQELLDRRSAEMVRR